LPATPWANRFEEFPNPKEAAELLAAHERELRLIRHPRLRCSFAFSVFCRGWVESVSIRVHPWLNNSAFNFVSVQEVSPFQSAFISGHQLVES